MKRLNQAPLAVLLLVAAAAAQAQGAKGQSMEERLRAELRNVTAQLQQARGELAQLQTAPVAAKPVAAAPASDKLKQELARSQAQLAHERAERARLAEEQGRSAVAAQEAAASLKQYRQANDTLAGAGKNGAVERQRLDAEITAQRATLARCESQNAQLYAAGKDILAAYAALDLVDVMRARQPFAAQSRVRLDDIAQQYGDRLYQGRFDARAASAPAPASAPASAPATAPAAN